MSEGASSAAAEWRRHWPLVAATAAGMSLASMLTAAFGVMLAPIEAELGWTRAQISSGPAVVSFMGLFLAAPAGYLIDRFGARPCGIFVVLISCVATVLLAVVDELWQWWAVWSLVGISAAFTSTVWLAPVSTIFNAGRGMAIALTISGLGVSMALVPGISEYFVQNHSWRTGFVALAAIWFAITLPPVLAFVPKLQPGAGSEASEGGAAGEAMALTGLTPRQGFLSPTFYLLFFASLFSSMTGVALILNLVPVLTFTGLARAEAVMVAGSMGVASIIGWIAGGWLMDHFEVRKLAMTAALGAMGLPAMLLLAPGVVWGALLGVVAYGLTAGMIMNAIVYLTSTHLGARSFGLFYGAISITTTVAQGIGPLTANYIYDTTLSYTPVIWAAIPGYLIAALLFAALRPARELTRRAGTA